MTADLIHLDGRPVIIGGGLAGLMTALSLAPEPVILITKAPLGEQASSSWAQGGLAAALGNDDDPALHLADTLAAGDGLCDEAAARAIVEAAPEAIAALDRRGVRFDRSGDGRFELGREAAHSRRRIIHAEGDGTGRELMRALIAAVRRSPSITIIEGLEARRLLVEDGAIAGVLAQSNAGIAHFSTGRVVLATGGLGGLFFETTNPMGNFGQGLALAARAGAALADLEFIQFHPTALDGPSRPMQLISEAVRGEGATLVDETGHRFMSDVPGAELAPRDVVARAIWRHLADGHKVFLDARHSLGPRFAARFPSITAFCQASGLDPAAEPLPVKPAVHYHMGGIAVDAAGRSSVPGLWALGEVASTGLHGANRLASNSLTEAVVCAKQVAESLSGSPRTKIRRAKIADLPPLPDASAVRPIVSQSLGLMRDGPALRQAITELLPLAHSNSAAADPALVGLMIAVAALRREESRGGHYRTDFPLPAATARRATVRLDEAFAQARELTETPRPVRKAQS
ncbi:L-aspartate oxidase [Taklimakanibacter deserti]|uniref:L-aspartate oxidase n=1 Tax=Taklimakanibacter deserti TaxID=2267839 RepID=UPI000E65399D